MKNTSRFLSITLLCFVSVGLTEAQIISSFPHTQNFESFNLCAGVCNTACVLSGGWENAIDDQIDWTTFSGPTSTVNTGPDADHTLGTSVGKYLYVESSSPCTLNTASLLTPELDLTGITNFSVDFWYHLYGNSLGTLHADVSTNGGLNFTDDIVPSWSQNSNAWTKKTISLNAYAGDTIILRIRGVTGSGSQSDIGLDDFTFYVQQATDAGVVSINEPVLPLAAGVNNVAVSIKNFGFTDLMSASIGWSVNGAVQSPYSWVDTLASGQTSSSIIIGSYNFPQGTTDLKVWTSNPNGLTDSDHGNDTLDLTLCPSFSGTFTIGGTSPDFSDFSDAVGAMVTCGISGPVVFNVSPGSGPYSQQVRIPYISGSSAVNTITFNGNGETLSFNANSTNRHVIKLDGAKHVILDSLTIVGTNVSYTWGVHLINQADSNIIRNCVVDVSANGSVLSDNSVGIVASASTTAVNTAGNNASSLVIENNTITGGYQGIRIHGQFSSSTNNRITGNTISNFYSHGIYLSNCDNALVSANDISRGGLLNVGVFYGINIDAGVVRTVVEKNRIHNTHDSALSPTTLSHGIAFNSTDATAGNENVVVNNAIYNFNSDGTIYGIYNSGSDGAHYFHNTISLDEATTAGGITEGFYQTGAASNIFFKNNIVSVKREGTGDKHCVYFNTMTSSITCDYNIYFTDTAINSVGYWGGSDYGTLSDWQTANASAYDANSLFLDPVFSSPAAGNLTPLNPSADNTGQGVGVTEDISGNTRDVNNPDAGAYEFTSSSDDAALDWVSPVPPVSAGNKTITVRLSNSIASSSAINSASLSYSDGNTPVTQQFTGLNILPGDSQDISFLTAYNLTSFVTLKAYINSINGVGELVQANDTVRQDICPALSGTYTINKNVAASSTNFQSFNSAVGALSTCGVGATTTFNVTSNTGPYFEQFEIQKIAGAGSASPVVINGNGNLVNANPSSANRAIIRLNGADYVTLNDLVIVGTDTTYGWGIHLTNQADNNTINNCDIRFSSNPTATPDNFVGIGATTSTVSISSGGNTANYTTISNCDIASKGYGIRLNGGNGTNVKGNKITGNTIRDFYSHGIYLSEADSTQISGNDIHRMNLVNAGPFSGITLVTGCENTLIERNRIHNTHDAAADVSSSAYCITLAAADAAVGKENRVVNNLIYNINGNGIISAIDNISSDNAKYYHNTIVLDESSASTNDYTHGFRQESVAAGVDFRNNIVFVKRGGTGTKHCIYFPTTGSGITSDHNVLVMDSVGGSNYTGHYGGIDYTTFDDWKTATAFDQNSSDVDPLFVDATNDNFIPTAAGVNDIGTGLSVTTDFNQAARSSTSPDPGAFEFAAAGVGLDASITWVSPVAPVAPGSKIITVNIANLQSTTINDLSLSYTDGTSIITQSFNALSIDSGANQNLSFTTTFSFATTIYLRAYINSINGTTDDNQSNDTTEFQLLCLPLSGSYTINSGAPVSLSNFQNFTDAVAALVSCGVSAPIVFNVVSASGPYNEQITIPFISGSSAINTITFLGNNNSLSFSPTINDRQVLMLDGAKHVTIRDLNIVGTNSDYGYGVLFTNSADSNVISGCTIDVSAVTNTTSNTNSCAVLFSGSNTSTLIAGNNGSNNTISNNTIIGGHYGVRVNGFVAVQNSILNNIVRYFYAYGIYLQDADGTEILSNDITRANRVDVTTFNGIYLSSGNLNTLVERNRIHNTHDNASNRSQASNAINFSNCDAPTGQENRVINNSIYNMNGQGAIYAIFNTSSDGAYYYHNSISLDEIDSVGGQTIGFYQSSFADNIDFRNNVISVKRSGSGKKYCVAFAATTSNITCDYNIFYVPSDTSHYVGQYGTTNYSTLALWQTVGGNAFDQNSLFADPIFASATTGNLTPLNGSLDDKGVPIGVAVDITGASRDTLNPDIGAFEFTPSQFDATVISLLEPMNFSCGSSSLNITAVISNFGFDIINSTTVTAYITGGFSDTLAAVSNVSLATGQTDTVQLGSINFTSGGILNVTVIAKTAGDLNPANDTLRSTITINPAATQPVLGAYNDTVCTGLSATINVISNPNLTYTWFDMPSGGSIVHSGSSFTTPALNSPVTYYVEASSPFKHNVGPANNSIGTGGNFTNVGGQGLLFDVYKYLTLDSVSVYVNDTGTVYVELTDPANNIIYDVIGVQVHVPGVKVSIPVGLEIVPGSYRIDANGSTTNGLYRNDSGANYPYTTPGIISITGSTNIPGNYFFFYDWKITAYECPSSRTAATVFVDSIAPVLATYSYLIGSSGLDVSFTADDTSSGNSFNWSFGDGANDAGMVTTHQYANDGIYTVCLTVENSCSQDSLCQSLTLCGPFQGAFAFDAFGQTVDFQFNGNGIPASYLWNFGDNSTSNTDAPSHTYQSAGTYTVTLITENLCGEVDTSSQTITLCETVNAEFTFSQIAPNSLVFDFASISTGNPSSLFWDFGDGTYDTTNTATTHTFPSHGSYNVALIVVDACGDLDTFSQSVITCLQTMAEFSASVQNDNITVNTVNTSSGTNLTFNWNFGDNSTSTLEAPSHTYSATGIFTITLIVTDDCAQMDTFMQDVSISVGIVTVNFDFNLSIYPNPNDGEFELSFELSKPGIVNVVLTNILGQAVYENMAFNLAGQHSRNINVIQFPKGVYILQLTIENKVDVRKIIVD